MRLRLTVLSTLLLSVAGLAVGQPPLNPPQRLPSPIRAPQPMDLQQLRERQRQRSQEQGREAMRRLGVEPPPTQADIRRDLERRKQGYRKESQRQRLYALLKENEASQAASPERRRKAYRDQVYSSYYVPAYLELEKTLSGEQAASVKRAVYLSELPLLRGSLTYESFCAEIGGLVETCRRIAAAQGGDWSDYDARLNALTALYADTVELDGRTRLPFRYDFDDPFGQRDYRSVSVAKLIETGKGQCRSMPLLYKILADELGIVAKIAFTPNHSYVVVKASDGQWYGFETTSGSFAAPSWFASSGFVTNEAYRNGLYLRPIDEKETVAYCLQTLGESYAFEFGYGEFVLACANLGLRHDPSSAYAWLLKSNYVTRDVRRELREKGDPPYEKLAEYPELKGRFDYMERLYSEIERLGHLHMAEEQYLQWLQTAPKD